MLTRGSEWHRWEPHIHAPGTLFNNQFGGEESWGAYLTKLENLTPSVEALGITDYYVTTLYEQLRKYKDEGRLPGVKLLFPNIELRLSVASRKGFVNLHLLICPDDPDHINEIERFLSRLKFPAFGDRFDCTKADLIRLGKKADSTIQDDGAALKHGASQFKVDFNELRNLYAESEWARNNILIAIAGGADDGTSGIRQASDTTIRAEIEAFSHIIFASSTAQREFWTGKKGVTIAELVTRYGGCKPCMHGSDSHSLGDVGAPVENRYTWIKGGLEFDTLKQACIEPEGRAYVGENPPPSSSPSQSISKITVESADWIETPEIPLNSGLVAIIGARGSGKTALADIIATGCDGVNTNQSSEDGRTSPSFLSRAGELIGDAKVNIVWGNDEIVSRRLDGAIRADGIKFPRVRYLSQQFVEELCSSRGMSDGLIKEIERVIYAAHSEDEKMWAGDFDELRRDKTLVFKQSREGSESAIRDISKRISEELEKEKSVTYLRQQIEQKKKTLDNYNADKGKLVVKGTPEQLKRHKQLTDVLADKKAKIHALKNQKLAFTALQDDVKSTRLNRSPEMLRQAQQKFISSGLSSEQWDQFLLVFKGNVDDSLNTYISWADGQIAALTGQVVNACDPAIQLIKDDADLNIVSLNTLSAEITRLENLFGADKLIRDKYTALSTKASQEAAQIKQLEERLADANGASERVTNLRAERGRAYINIFEAIIGEKTALGELYGPLARNLEQAAGTLKKLGFSVVRVADVKSWGEYAEERLLDRRKSGPFQGRGSFTKLAEAELKSVWENGSATDIESAITNFSNKYRGDLFAHAQYSAEQKAEYREWLKDVAHWLYRTDHISVRYELSYDGVDIRKLSPGTRGIVLLLLYLALDDSDDRPLIIDQPEENLDPKSVFDELVGLFIKAKSKRQVIIVTHNANLVINTDADQIIVANSAAHHADGLPNIRYISGGLENAAIRKIVCDILEGGELAFRERSRRLRVRLDR